MSNGADRVALAAQIDNLVTCTPAYDIHTHLYAPVFGDLLLWGIDDLLVYHYLISEAFRYFDISYEQFWSLSKTEQADRIWDALFIQHSPISEACRGVLTTLNRLGLDVTQRDLPAVRKWFAAWKADDYINHCMELARVKKICMTNSPFDAQERPAWEQGFSGDPRFTSGLRIDPLLMEWEKTVPQLQGWGYEVDAGFGGKTVSEVRRFLGDWSKRMNALYVMVSLPPDFAFPDKSARGRLIEAAVLPHCREYNMPFAVMLGVKRLVNPHLRLAGDGVGKSDLQALENLCAQHQDTKFLTTVLSRENQHELCVMARKFRNLHIFGCWWFTNVPYVVEEMTRMRLELIGLSATLQHSDARVLDQLIYKWDHSRRIIAKVLTDKYTDLAATGWHVTEAELQRDVDDVLGGSFESFLQRGL